jgi:hypothetical protein
MPTNKTRDCLQASWIERLVCNSARWPPRELKKAESCLRLVRTTQMSGGLRELLLLYAQEEDEHEEEQHVEDALQRRPIYPAPQLPLPQASTQLRMPDTHPPPVMLTARPAPYKPLSALKLHSQLQHHTPAQPQHVAPSRGLLFLFSTRRPSQRLSTILRFGSTTSSICHRNSHLRRKRSCQLPLHGIDEARDGWFLARGRRRGQRLLERSVRRHRKGP